MSKMIGAIAAALLSVAVLAACSGQATVTGKHPCTRKDRAAWCLTTAGGHTVYVPYSTYHSARVGESYDSTDGSVHPADVPADDGGHAVVADGR